MKLDKAAVARIKNATPKKQKGASSLEYIMLAAVIIVIVGAAFTTGLGDQVVDFVADIFADATTEPTAPTGTQ
mgnify:FL=1